MLVRTFVALPVAETGLAKSLVAAQMAIGRGGGRVKWVPSHHFHFTLKFLGEIDGSRLQVVRAAVAAAVKGEESFTLELTGVGAFPGPEGARVIWAGTGAGSASLVALANRVEQALVDVGFPRDRRRFSPHLTLGRVAEDGLVPGLTAAILAERERVVGAVNADRVIVYRSDLHPAGPAYTALETCPLTRPGGGVGDRAGAL